MAKPGDDDDDLEVEIDDEGLDIEVEDDTPEADRGRAPMPEDIVKQLENDELDEYEGKAKTTLKQLKKVWHDERREKEREEREKQEAIKTAQRLLEENRNLKKTLTDGEEMLYGSFKSHAELQLEEARRAYKEAYDSGDTDKVIEAQEQLQAANARIENLKGRKGPLQLPDTEVDLPQQGAVPLPDAKTQAWQKRNDWFGSDEEMTATALGLHQKLFSQKGQEFIGTDDYWKQIDNTIRRRFPEYFGEQEKPARRARTNNVVSPASRSTSTKKIVLSKSQVAVAKKLGLTNEQYAREAMKLEQ